MLSVCNSCGDYFDGEWMRYCPTEGQPLKTLDAGDPGWNDALAVVQKKAKLKRRQQLRVKLSRLFLIVITVLIIVMVVCVVVVNGLIYLREPRGPEVVPPVSAHVPVEAPSIKPAALPSPSLSPSPSPSPSPSLSPSPSPAKCCQARMEAESKAIKLEVERTIEAERAQIFAANAPPPPLEVTLSPVKYEFDFAKDCRSAGVTANYEWQIKHPAKDQTTTKSKRVVACVKTDGQWICS